MTPHTLVHSFIRRWQRHDFILEKTCELSLWRLRRSGRVNLWRPKMTSSRYMFTEHFNSKSTDWEYNAQLKRVSQADDDVGERMIELNVLMATLNGWLNVIHDKMLCNYFPARNRLFIRHADVLARHESRRVFLNHIFSSHWKQIHHSLKSIIPFGLDIFFLNQRPYGVVMLGLGLRLYISLIDFNKTATIMWHQAERENTAVTLPPWFWPPLITRLSSVSAGKHSLWIVNLNK